MKSPNFMRMALPVCAGIALLAVQFAIPGNAQAKNCFPITVANMKGVPAGKFPQQYEKSEYEKLAGCDLKYQANPDIGALNKKIYGNPDLPSTVKRLPEEPLVVVPYDSIGKYGGTFDALSNATESGTSDFMAVRHVNLVRYSDDLETIVPNVAKGWEWNDDFTQLTFFLRKGH
jgi:peptide/nickel transport system substrate-binding protein